MAGSKHAAMARAAARGLVGAMAMTGTRRVTQSLGLLEQTPPQQVVGDAQPASRLSREQRAVVTELAHWAYGAGAGAVFGALPDRARARSAAGPAYGLAIWLVFELGIAPLLDVDYARERRVVGRAMVALDHVLYGLVVGGRVAREQTTDR